MKKILLLLSCIFLAQHAQAKQVTDPFYMPKQDSFLSTSYFEYQKYHLKSPEAARHHLRSQTLAKKMEYGLSDRAALSVMLSNSWTRRKDDFKITHKENTNINWAVGGHYDLYSTENYFLQAKIHYLQKETHHARGAYKALDANVRTGYDLGVLLPYVGVWGQLPIAQSTTADDKIKCGSYVGLYTDIQFIAVDVSLNYTYDRIDMSNKLATHSALNFLIGENLALGGYFDYTLIDKKARKKDADGHTIGGQMIIHF